MRDCPSLVTGVQLGASIAGKLLWEPTSFSRELLRRRVPADRSRLGALFALHPPQIEDPQAQLLDHLPVSRELEQPAALFDLRTEGCRVPSRGVALSVNKPPLRLSVRIDANGASWRKQVNPLALSTCT